MDINLSPIFKHFSRPLRTESDSVEGAWKFIVVTFLTLNLFIILGSLYLFWISNSADKDLSQNTQKKSEVFKENNLEEVVAAFSERKDVFTRIQTESPNAVDPSL